MKVRPHPTKSKIDDTQTFGEDGSVQIVSSIFHIDDNQSFNVVKFPTLSGTTGKLRIPRELFRSPTKVTDLLIKANADASVTVHAVKTASEAAAVSPPPHQEITRRAGWHIDGLSFVYPTETFGQLSGKLLYDRDSQINPALGLMQGSLEAWNDGLREPCKYSDYLIFTTSVAAASSLLDVIGQDRRCHLSPSWDQP
ncbi:MAG: DUF927 domain-containing protein [Afipia sp.]|nr:DUF927 domain-containing protein [Afipia sp.]